MKKSWKRWATGGIAVLLLCMYGWGQFAIRFDKLSTHVLERAVDIAIGYVVAEEGFKYPYPGPGPAEFEVPACDTVDGNGRELFWCVTIGRGNDFTGCSRWRFEDCLVFRAESYLLSRPDFLGKTIDALHHPCKYLPSPEEIAASTTMDKHNKFYYGRYWKKAGCAPGTARDFRKIVINFYDASGAIVAQYVKRSEFSKCLDDGQSPLFKYLMRECVVAS